MQRITVFALVTALLLPEGGGLRAESVTVRAEQGELAYPLWVKQNAQIRFRVCGKWTMWDRWELVDAQGHTHFEQQVDGFRLGQLLGRVEGGETFAVRDGLSYTSPVAGRLILYPNRGRYIHLQAKGRLEVDVQGARPITAAEAEKRLGWDRAQLDTARGVAYLSEREKGVVLYLNRARVNPPLFARLYVKPHAARIAAARECYEQMLRTPPRPPLQPSKALTLAARDHALDMGRTGRIGHRGSDGSNLAARVSRYGHWKRRLAENCSYGWDDPLQIVLQELIDDGVSGRGHRKNVLNPQLHYVGVALRPHKQHRHNCVQDFAGEIKDK